MVHVTKKHRVQPGMTMPRIASWMKCHLAETYGVSQVKTKVKEWSRQGHNLCKGPEMRGVLCWGN